jgi:L-ascorbate metabolism protein UlaG (beta-lactamase superfamily)
MRLRYLGHSCFSITTGSGIRIVTDPFSGIPGLKMPAVQAEIVTVSHSHADHNNVNGVGGNFLIAMKPGVTESEGVTLCGIESFHDNLHGRLRGQNIIFTIKADGLTICHLGDLGHTLSDDQLAQIGHVDILMVPVGEIFTFSVNDALKTVNQINPVVTIPMHYSLTGPGFGLKNVQKFLSIAGDFDKADSCEVEITSENIGEYKGIIVMKS